METAEMKALGYYELKDEQAAAEKRLVSLKRKVDESQALANYFEDLIACLQAEITARGTER